MLRVLALSLAAALPLVDLVFATPQAPAPRKVAFLVGIGKYDHKFTDLGTAPENDVGELAKELTGFEVVTLTGSKADNDPHRATKKNIEARFKELLDGTGGKRPIRDGDTVLVLLCGHGIEEKATDPATGKPDKDAQPFFCPVDARPDDTNTMVPLNALIRTSEVFGGTNLFLVDACREVPPDANRGTRTGIQGKKVALPDKTAVLFACGSGQLSHQSDKLDKGHGLFTFAVLKTLRGGGRVTWTKLVNGVEEAFESDELKAHITDKRGQQPVEAKGQLGATELVAKRDDIAKKERKGGDTTEFEIADGVKMVFCYVPADAEAQLGSPKSERDAVLKLIKKEKEPEWLASEAEGLRGKYKPRKGFWLGKYEVTQGEWEKVMGSNPSYFRPFQETVRKAEVNDTSRFPVENVSWDNICGKDGNSGAETFLGKLNARSGKEKAFGKTGTFVLPAEDEWEYTCRGGRGNTQAFYWGDELDGSQANCDGTAAYSAPNTKNYLQRTCAVEFDNDGQYPKHPWGLKHMHGNVWEWCQNKYKQSEDRRSVRGGSWSFNARNCRAAGRSSDAPDLRSLDIGFRVLFRLD